MTSRSDAVPVSEMRDALRRAIGAASLRSVAAEVGLSPSGLRSFVAGGRPHPRTVYLVTGWYVRHSKLADTDTSTAQAGVAVLVDHLSQGAREEATRRIKELLRDMSRRDGRPVPRWVKEIG